MQFGPILEKLQAYKKQLIIVVLALIVLCIGIPVFMSATEDRTPGRISAYRSYLTDLGKLAREQKRYITSSALTNANTNLGVFVSGALNRLESYQEKAGAAAANAELVARHKTTLGGIETSLTQSRLSNTYEATYIDLITLELAALKREADSLAGREGSLRHETFQEISGQLAQSIKTFEAAGGTGDEDSDASD